MNSKLLIYISTFLASSTSLNAQQLGDGGSGGIRSGQVIGGNGGGFFQWGGSGGNTTTTNGFPPTQQGRGGEGAVNNGDRNITGKPGEIGFIIQNSTDVLPDMNALDPANPANGRDGRVIAGTTTTAGGGGGGVYAIITADNFIITNFVAGGTGGRAAQQNDTDQAIQGAGGGGVGVVFNGGVLNIAAGSGRIAGGTGGTMIKANENATPLAQINQNEYGGGGGVGLVVLKGTVNNNGVIVGGDGGKGITNDKNGSAGAGSVIGSNIIFNNNGSITSGPMTFGFPVPPNNFDPAAGMIILGDNNLLNNTKLGRITTPGAANSVTTSSVPSLLVAGNSNRIVNAGSISPFNPVGNLTSIRITGNNNTLELRNGQSMTRDVVASGANNHFALGGSEDSTFAISRLGSTTNQGIRGFVDFEKIGTSTWTVTGKTAETGTWAIREGTLALSLDGDLSSASSVTVNAGLDISQITPTSTTVNNFSGGANGRVNLGSKNLIIQEATAQTYAGIISGNGGIAKNGPGSLTLSGANTYRGLTSVNQGALIQGAVGGFSAASSYQVGNNTTLNLNGFGTTVAALSNSGTVNFGGTVGTTLNVSGNYTGSGTLIMNTTLGSDNSVTDRLVVAGSTSGTTNVQVTNRGGLGARTQEGIRIIQVGGASNGIFNLQSDFTTQDNKKAIVAGAFAYTLEKNGVSTPNDGNWYLRSEVGNIIPIDPTKPGNNNSTTAAGARFNPGAPLYESYAQSIKSLNNLPTFQQRSGNRYWNGAANPTLEQGDGPGLSNAVPSPDGRATITGQGVWGRIEAAYSRFDPRSSITGSKQNVDTLIVQAGVDGQLFENESGEIITGFTAQYGRATGKTSSLHGNGKVNTDGYGLGGTLTWFGTSGLYLDGQAQTMWYNSDINSDTALQTLASGNKSFGYSLSMEGGKHTDINQYWSLTPQAQLVFASLDINGFNDPWGSAVGFNKDDSLIGRVGLSADYKNAWRDNNGLLVRTSVYGIANLYREFLNSSKVTLAGVNFIAQNDKTWGGVGAGGTYTWADDKYSLFGEGSINTSLQNFADSYSVKGTFGFKIKF